MSEASTTSSTLDAALEVAARGWPVFPVRSTESKKVPLVNWKDEATTDPERIDHWFRAVFPRAMIGVPMGEATGIFAVDVDTRDGGREAWAKLVAEKGLPETRRHATPSGGEHIFFKWRPGISNSTGGLPPGNDVRAAGGLVVWAGSRNWQGKRYEIVADVEIAEPPDWLVEMIGTSRTGQIDWGNKPLPPSLLAALKAHAGKGVSRNAYDLPKQADPERLRAALAVVPSDDYQIWFEVGCALWNELGSVGLPLFEEWSRKSAKYEARECARQWERCQGYGFRAGTIFHHANEADPAWRRVVPHVAEPEATVTADVAEPPQALNKPDAVDPPPQALDEPDAAEPQVPATGVEPAPAPIRMAPPIGLWMHGEAQPEPPRWMIRNRLPEGGVALLAGQWGVGKTFMWLDIAGCVMTGLPWTGEPVYRPGGVLAFTPEGAASIPMRLAALVEHSLAPRIGESTLFERKPNLARLPFARANACPTLLAGGGRPNDKGLREMIATAKAIGEQFKADFDLPLALIVVDTAMAAAGWTSEDSNSEVGIVWNMLREMSEDTGALVLIVDHFGKDPTRGTRGGSAKEGNADTVIALLGERSDTGEVKDTRAVLRKQRDGPQGLELPFAARIVPMGRDKHGQELTQRVIDWNVKREPPRQRASGGRTAFMEALTAVLEEHGRQEGKLRVVAKSHVLSRFKTLYQAEKPEAQDEAVRSAFKRGFSSGDVGQDTFDGVPCMWIKDDGHI